MRHLLKGRASGQLGMLVIGLTGGIGSGKTTVSKYLEALGAEVIDADKVGHITYLPDTPAWRDLIDTWGEGLLQANREIDRKKLGAIVFSDPSNLEKLNSIVHPRMRDIMNDQIEGFRKGKKKVVVLDAAILIEAKWTSLVDEVWVTAAPEEVVVKRVMARNSWDEEQVRSRMSSQMSNDERQGYAHVVIDTDATLQEVEERVRILFGERCVSTG